MFGKSITTIILALLVVSQREVDGAAVKRASPQLKFLGHFKNTATILNGVNEGGHVQQSSFYFLSTNAAAHSTAANDCKEYLGPEATLLNIETEEELAEVIKLLASSDDTGSLYWTGGKYDTNSRKLVWGNNVEIGSSAPWDVGHPNTQLPATRVAAYTVGGLKLRTQFQTLTTRYICELPLEALSTSQSGLKYVGQYKSPQVKIGINGMSTRQSSFYFLSTNAAAFQNAENDCKEFLGEDATLAYIETQEELGNVTKFLEGSDDTGSLYWVGGKYDTVKKTFVWLNGAEVGPWAPWDTGMPNTRTQLTRISAKTVGGIKLQTQFNTITNRYMCELSADLPEEEPIPCYNDNDLVIVVDSSGSIGQSNYMVALEFTTRLAIAWADNSNNRVGVFVYSNTVEQIIGITESLSVAEIRSRVYNAPYLNGGTASHLGINRALDEFTNNNRAVPKNLVFLTDGASNSASDTIAAAGRVESAGIRAFSVGIGSSLNPTELLAIAGGKQEHVFNTDGFADLLKLLQPVSRKVCE